MTDPDGQPIGFDLPPEIEEIRRRTRAFVESRILPVEQTAPAGTRMTISASTRWSGCARRRGPTVCGRPRPRRRGAAWRCPSSARR